MLTPDQEDRIDYLIKRRKDMCEVLSLLRETYADLQVYKKSVAAYDKKVFDKIKRKYQNES